MTKRFGHELQTDAYTNLILGTRPAHQSRRVFAAARALGYALEGHGIGPDLGALAPYVDVGPDHPDGWFIGVEDAASATDPSGQRGLYVSVEQPHHLHVVEAPELAAVTGGRGSRRAEAQVAPFSLTQMREGDGLELPDLSGAESVEWPSLRISTGGVARALARQVADHHMAIRRGGQQVHPGFGNTFQTAFAMMLDYSSLPR